MTSMLLLQIEDCSIIDMCVDSIKIRGSDSGRNNIIIFCVTSLCACYFIVYSVTEYHIVDVGIINHIHSKVNT